MKNETYKVLVYKFDWKLKKSDPYAEAVAKSKRQLLVEGIKKDLVKRFSGYSITALVRKFGSHKAIEAGLTKLQNRTGVIISNGDDCVIFYVPENKKYFIDHINAISPKWVTKIILEKNIDEEEI